VARGAEPAEVQLGLARAAAPLHRGGGLGRREVAAAPYSLDGWRIDVAKPLPIDNRTVLLLLEAIQQFQGRTLSYRALDVEQIGYVYEGLLERTVKRTAELTLELDGTKNAQSPWVTLAELESARLDGAERLAELLQQRSGSSASRVRNDLARPVDDALADRVLTACHGDTALRDRIKNLETELNQK